LSQSRTNIRNLIRVSNLTPEERFVHLRALYHSPRFFIDKTERISSKKTKPANYFIFLDIDSTITHEDGLQTDPRCIPVLCQMQKWHHKIFLISGRTKDKVAEIIKKLDIEKFAIAENGGLIIENKRIRRTLGNKKLCKKEYNKLKKHISLKIEKKIRSNTEIILVKQNNLKEVIAKIEGLQLQIKIDPSKRYWHLHEFTVDKGSTLNEFIGMNKIDWTKTIAFGDSWIDEPMLKLTKYGYLVGNADKKLKKTFEKRFILKRERFEGVMEGLMKYEPKLKKLIRDKGYFREGYLSNPDP